MIGTKDKYYMNIKNVGQLYLTHFCQENTRFLFLFRSYFFYLAERTWYILYMDINIEHTTLAHRVQAFMTKRFLPKSNLNEAKHFIICFFCWKICGSWNFNLFPTRTFQPLRHNLFCTKLVPVLCYYFLYKEKVKLSSDTTNCENQQEKNWLWLEVTY